MKGFYSFCRGLLYLPVKLIFPVKLIGKENLPLGKKVITVSNHLSNLDIALVAVNISGYRRIIAKKELTANKLFAKLMDWAGAIPVDRGQADLGAIRKVMTALKNGEGITIFPEGTRNKSGEELQEVKAGAALFALKGDAEIVPIMLLHRQRAFRRNYMYVAPPFSVADLCGGRVDGAAVGRAAKKIEIEMKRAKDYIEDYVYNHRAQQFKREKKEKKLRERAYKKQAKLANKNLKAYFKGIKS